MKITVFGGSSPREESTDYQFAYQLGAALASHGHVVLTGGYMGTMEAASKGAAEAGGHVIGVTCQEIENWRNVGCNAWVTEELRQVSLIERINVLINLCDTAIALPGGPGTLAEFVLMWNLMQINSIPIRPLILVGKGWRNTITTFYHEQSNFISTPLQQLLTFADTIEQIMELITGNSSPKDDLNRKL